jgi:hypothetical protein
MAVDEDDVQIELGQEVGGRDPGDSRTDDANPTGLLLVKPWEVMRPVVIQPEGEFLFLEYGFI